MTALALKDQIEEVLRNALEIDSVGDEASFISSLDSIQRLNVLVALEDHFAIILEPEADEVMDSLPALVRAVERRLPS